MSAVVTAPEPPEAEVAACMEEAREIARTAHREWSRTAPVANLRAFTADVFARALAARDAELRALRAANAELTATLADLRRVGTYAAPRNDGDAVLLSGTFETAHPVSGHAGEPVLVFVADKAREVTK